jgi:hypothetical protein
MDDISVVFCHKRIKHSNGRHVKFCSKEEDDMILSNRSYVLPENSQSFWFTRNDSSEFLDTTLNKAPQVLVNKPVELLGYSDFRNPSDMPHGLGMGMVMEPDCS